MEMSGFRRNAAGIYTRVSTREQEEDGLSLDFQKHLCTVAAEAAGATSITYFSDPAHSGTEWERPDLQDFLSRLDEFDILYVFRLDRLSRSVRDWANIMAMMADRNVGFFSVTEKFDFSSPFGKAMMAMLAVFAELFVDILRENVRAALAERVRRGLRNGGIPLGYRKPKDPSDPILPDDEALPLVLDIFQRYSEGQSLNQITRTLAGTGGARGGQILPTTLIKIISNPAYIGKARRGKEEYDGVHDPIIDRDLWLQCNRRLQRNSYVAPSSRNRSLGSLYRCGLCGRRMVATGTDQGGPRSIRYYRCQTPAMDGSHETLTVSLLTTDAVTWQVVRDLVSEGVFKEAARAAAKRLRAKPKADPTVALREESAELQRQIAFAYQAQAGGALDLETLLEVNRPLVARREKIAQELARMERPDDSAEVLALTLPTLEEIIGGGDIEAQRNLLAAIFERVEVHRDRYVYAPQVPGLPTLEVKRPKYYSAKRGSDLNLNYC